MNRGTFLIALACLFLGMTGSRAEDVESHGGKIDLKSCFQRYHEAYVDWFVKSPGNGVSRMPSVEDKRLGDAGIVLKGGKYEIREILLVSILKHDPPVVYVPENGRPLQMRMLLGDKSSAHKADHANTPTRPLDEFESKAIQKFRENRGELAFGDELRFAGPIRATSSCLACHDVKEGDLLGAFVYTLGKTGKGESR